MSVSLSSVYFIESVWRLFMTYKKYIIVKFHSQLIVKYVLLYYYLLFIYFCYIYAYVLFFVCYFKIRRNLQTSMTFSTWKPINVFLRYDTFKQYDVFDMETDEWYHFYFVLFYCPERNRWFPHGRSCSDILQ